MGGQAPEFSHPIMNEGRGMGGSQAGEGGLAHLQATYMSPQLFLVSACFKFP
jgi:hypothetical protein